MTTETVHYDDTPTLVATRPIERRKITRTRNIQGGMPCIAGTRVTTAGPWSLHKGGYDLVQIRQQYPHCTEEQLQAAIDYEAKKAKRKDPVARKLKANGRACKQRGTRAEHAVAKVLGEGWSRVPMSGALGGELSGDVRYRGVKEKPAIRTLEVKRRAGCDTMLRKQLSQGGADALVRVPGVLAGSTTSAEPLVTMTLTKFSLLLAEAGYDRC